MVSRKTNYIKMPTMKEINSWPKKYTGASFFCGGGGSSTGHKMAGIDIRYANEFVPSAQESYAANHPSAILDGSDIRQLKASDVLTALKMKKGELDLLDGSPPCFPANTLITTARGLINIQDVQVGDKVFTHEGRWQLVTKCMNRAFTGNMYLITAGIRMVHATEEHPFLVMRDSDWGNPIWVMAEELFVGDYAIQPQVDNPSKNLVAKIDSITSYWAENVQVYNLHVETDETYVANGFAVHNCSSYSNAGTRDKGWGKEKLYSDNIKQRTDDLFPEFIRILKGIMPKTFTIENVPGLSQGKAKGVFLAVMRELKACGYQVSCREIVGSKLGVPQQRHRLIFVGVRNDLVEMGLTHQYPRPLPGPVPTLRQAHPHIVALKGKMAGGLNTYVPSDIPCYTVLASDFRIKDTASFSFGAFIEEESGERRKMTVKELKVVSSFPPDYKLKGTVEQQIERIGRAVPPLMMAFVTQSIIKTVLEPYYKIKGKKK